MSNPRLAGKEWRIKHISTGLVLSLVAAACGHSEPFLLGTTPVGPYNSGPDIQLTLNEEQSYWPAWTQDGRGILYSFVSPGALSIHRCIGLLPAAGGTLLWQLCDNRATQTDSTNSFTAYALNSDGRLIYAEAVSPAGIQSLTPRFNTLWLADTASPFVRTQLLTLPITIDGTLVGWLSDISWSGPSTFVALAQDLSIQFNCPRECNPEDTILVANGGIVVRGAIVGGRATLEGVAGTSGATGYSLAEGAATIVFTRLHDMRLYKVAALGGAASVLTTIPSSGPNTKIYELLGVSCKATRCIVAADPVWLFDTPPDVAPPNAARGVQAGSKLLFSVSTVDGGTQPLRTTDDLVATPIISPTSGDVVVQIGGVLGHLQTVGLNTSRLHLLPGLLQ